jgi:glycosyltransferase involved in cell wall biosynthesis
LPVILYRTYRVSPLDQLNERNLLFVKFGGGLDKVKDRRGNLDYYDQWDGPTEFVDRTVWLMYRARSNGWTRLSEKTKIFEQKRVMYMFHFVALLLLIVKGVRIVNEENIAIVRSKDPFFCGLFGWILARLTDRPFCIYLHADYGDEQAEKGRSHYRMVGFRWFQTILAQFLFSRADGILPNRDSMKDWIYSLGDHQSRTWRFSKTIDMSPFRKIRKSWLDSWPAKSELVLSYAGRMNEVNFIHDTLQIAKLVLNKVSRAKLYMAGGGPMEDSIREFIRQHDLGKDVKLLRWISEEEVRTLRRHSDVALVLRGGYSLIEAAASGVPLISYDIDWHGELVQSEETGYLIEPGNVKNAAEKTEYLLKNPKKRTKMGKCAQELAFQRHDENLVADKKDKIHQTIFNRYNKGKAK